MIVKTFNAVVGLKYHWVLSLSPPHRDNTRSKTSVFQWKFLSISSAQVNFKQFGILTSDSMVEELVLW